MEGLMRGLRLSEAEMNGVKLSGEDRRKGLHPEAVENALGPIWCSMKGIDCKDLGDNVFLFTFKQEGGWKKAVENGPWMFEKELLVMEEYDPTKNVEEYSFSHVPIWVRVYKLPLGKMNLEAGTLIGDRVGEFVELDGLENGMAVGRCLRVKVKKCLAAPLMRGIMVEVDEKGRTIWCPMEYEYLPDFCFICGIIGHIDKGCSIRLKRGGEPQFGKWLKWVPPKKTITGDGSGAKSSDGGERVVSSPLKLALKGSVEEKGGAKKPGGEKGASKSLSFQENDVEQKEIEGKSGPPEEIGKELSGKENMVVDNIGTDIQSVGDSHSGLNIQSGEDNIVGKSRRGGAGIGSQEKRGSFKRIQRDHDSRDVNKVEKKGAEKERKRGADDMEVDMEEEERKRGKKNKIQKKGVDAEKGLTNDIDAGLSEQPCANQ
ncbi:hypothetical protein ACQ4PT_071768 [Festuca glaucescens]